MIQSLNKDGCSLPMGDLPSGLDQQAALTRGLLPMAAKRLPLETHKHLRSAWQAVAVQCVSYEPGDPWFKSHLSP